MYQTQQTEALCLSVYLYGAILFSRGIPGSVWQKQKRPAVKGLWMSFRALEILPVYKLAWYLVLLQCPDTVIL